MYNILFTPRAIQDFEKIGKDTQIRIAKKLKEYASSPIRHARKLINPKIGSYRFRMEIFVWFLISIMIIL